MELNQKHLFEYHFRDEMKRLDLNKDKVCKQILSCSNPTLNTKLRNPGTLTVNDITKLNNAGFEINRIIYSLTNN